MANVTVAAAEDLSLSGGNITFVLVVAAIAVVSLAMAALFRQEVLSADEGTDSMKEIGQAVQEGASAYLTRQFRTLGVFALLAFLLLFVLPGDAGVRIGRSI
ncbi:MAG: sodium/proton-translocating pyrophosphatase, partial [Nocardioidaceae bacterium]